MSFKGVKIVLYPVSYFYQPNTTYMPRQYMFYEPMYRYPHFRANDIQIKTNEVEYSNEYIKADLKYPEIQGLENKEIQNSINSSIRNDVMEFSRQMEEAAKESAEEARMSGGKFEPFVISSIYEITYNKHDIISISIVYYEFINGSHSYIKTSYNFNLNNGRSLSLKDLFKQGSNYQEILNREIRRELIMNREKYFPDTLENFKGIGEYHPFYLENGDIVVYFGFHEIAPLESEIPVFKIPFSSVKEYIKPVFLS